MKLKRRETEEEIEARLEARRIAREKRDYKAWLRAEAKEKAA